MEFVIQARQRCTGFVLVLTLIVMAILMLGTLAVIRSMTNTNIAAGNFAFREASLQASERAVALGMTQLQTIVNGGDGNNDLDGVYFSKRQTVNDSGVPNTIDWANVACINVAGAACPQTADEGSYRMQYYLERQCANNPGAGDIKNIKSLCDYETVNVTPEMIALRYRIIVRLLGPRGTSGFVEVMVSGPL